MSVHFMITLVALVGWYLCGIIGFHIVYGDFVRLFPERRNDKTLERVYLISSVCGGLASLVAAYIMRYIIDPYFIDPRRILRK